MCLAIAKLAGAEIPVEHLKTGFKNNDDGAGFSVVNKGRLITKKGFWNFYDFWQAFEPYQLDPAIIHFRLATAGKINKKNCHPFEMCHGLYSVIHNGILPHPSTEFRSDTHCFVYDVLEPLARKGELFTQEMFEMLEEHIGPYNKLCFLDRAGEIFIINEKQGDWEGDIWYSNWSYCSNYYGYSYSSPSSYKSKYIDEDEWVKLDEWEEYTTGKGYPRISDDDYWKRERESISLEDEAPWWRDKLTDGGAGWNI